MSKQRRGFTLIELLVVIAIIALLMGILMPALQRVNKQAKAVICQSYLKQWGTIFNMYCDGNDRKMPDRSAPESSNQGRWMHSLQHLYSDVKDLKLCPLVKKSSTDSGMYTVTSGWWGSTFTAWKVPADDASGGRVVGTYGSYGINGYCYNTYATLMGFATPDMHWKTPDVKGAAYIPLMMDAMFWTGWPQSINAPRPEPIMVGMNIPDSAGMQRYCLDRHNTRINAVFFDFSVRPVGLKELWTLNWHRGYDRSNSWTRAGGVTPDRWPYWMTECQDY
jgi:prepilin-type N-terminal cleavage/methylation domain-containing protein/prepilin-type processing-associated H-X9-DG protein